jgi:hypothetical protein
MSIGVSGTCSILKIRGVTRARVCVPVRLVILAALVAAANAASVACDSGKPEPGPATTTVVPAPEVISLAPSSSAAAEVHELVLSWKPIADIDRFVLCETVPPYGTTCEDKVGVSEAAVTAAGPIDDPQASGVWLQYLWLQSCGERECSRPPTAAGTIAHRVAYGANAWNFIVVVRRLERYEVEVALANASQGTPKSSTLIARTPGGSEIARCENVATGEWCGPFEGTLLSNDIVAEQIYGDLGVTVEFPVMPSTTAPELNQPPSP